MRCPNCQRLVKRTKGGRIASHYTEQFPVIGWAQKKVPGGGHNQGPAAVRCG